MNESSQGQIQKMARTLGERISPIALRYGFAELGLEEQLKGKPLVLVLGNYSAGKSTLINELIGRDVQATGQAPTDDGFTLLARGSDTLEQHEGQTALRDPDLPFARLGQEGRQFAAHLRVKRLRSPLLEQLNIIDTPGMLDAGSEKDRGYNYKAVVSELAALADLVLVLFDPHRPGTVRELQDTLRECLPRATREDRTVFVLNRVDECDSLKDLLRTYGTLCWNLSQATGRKDIPPILLSHRLGAGPLPLYLRDLGNQRDELHALVRAAPRHRLNHMVSYVDEQSAELEQFLQVLSGYGRERRKAWWRSFGVGLGLGVVMAALVLLLAGIGLLPMLEPDVLSGAALLCGLLVWGAWMGLWHGRRVRALHARRREHLDQLVDLRHQAQRDNWERVEGRLRSFLDQARPRYSLLGVARDLRRLRSFRQNALPEWRQMAAQRS